MVRLPKEVTCHLYNLRNAAPYLEGKVFITVTAGKKAFRTEAKSADILKNEGYNEEMCLPVG